MAESSDGPMRSNAATGWDSAGAARLRVTAQGARSATPGSGSAGRWRASAGARAGRSRRTRSVAVHLARGGRTAGDARDLGDEPRARPLSPAVRRREALARRAPDCARRRRRRPPAPARRGTDRSYGDCPRGTPMALLGRTPALSRARGGRSSVRKLAATRKATLARWLSPCGTSQPQERERKPPWCSGPHDRGGREDRYRAPLVSADLLGRRATRLLPSSGPGSIFDP
jgi:hypothetical protein